MRILDLFAGIGGFSLGLHRASKEFKTVAFCEQDPFCTQILNKHWPDVPVYPDIKELTYEKLKADGVVADPISKPRGYSCGMHSQISVNRENKRQPDRIGRRRATCGIYNKGSTNENKKGKPKELAGTIDIVCGGFPCQPFSQAGERRGKADDRDLWPEMFRVIKECEPTWVVGENVAGFINMELDRTVSDLESENYEVRVFILGAVAVQAPHQRQRCWIIGRKRDVGNSEHNGSSAIGDFWSIQGESNGQKKKIKQSKGTSGLPGTESDVADSATGRCEERQPQGKQTNDLSESGQRFPNDVADSGGTRSEAGLPGSDTGEERITKESNDRDHRQPRGEASDTRSTQRGMGHLADGLSAELLDIGSIWHIEPDIPRVTTGEKNRVKKLKALGNSVVPQIPEIIGRLIMEVEREIQ